MDWARDSIRWWDCFIWVWDRKFASALCFSELFRLNQCLQLAYKMMVYDIAVDKEMKTHIERTIAGSEHRTEGKLENLKLSTKSELDNLKLSMGLAIRK